MIYNRTVSQEVRDRILARVCARNLPAEVTIAAKRSTPMRSRFLRGEAEGDGLILIEAPTLGGRTVALRADEVIEVVIQVEGERYSFRSPVRGRTRVKLRGRNDVPAVALGYPLVLNHVQRRRYYRVRVPSLEPINVKCVTKSPDGADKVEHFEGQALDISGGGISLKLHKDQKRYARPGAHFALVFNIERDVVRLLGEARHAREITPKGDLALGVQFVNAEKTVSGRRAVQRISRYVTLRQREELKRKSGLE